MFFICLLLIIAIAIENQKRFLSDEQTQLVPIRVTDRQVKTQQTNVR